MPFDDTVTVSGAASWFREVIRSKIRIKAQSGGGYFTNTMENGDEQAGTIKFPVIDRVETAEIIAGRISEVSATAANMGIISLQPRSYEVSTYIDRINLRKMGPNLQGALASLMEKATRRRADIFRLEALQKFKSGEPDFGGKTGATADLTLFMEAAMPILGLDLSADNVFCAMPLNIFSQFMFAPEVSKASFAGTGDLPFSKNMLKTAKTVLGVTYFATPFEYWFDPGLEWPEYVDIFIWAREAMGAHTLYEDAAPNFWLQPQKEGTPILGKQGIGGAAIGILPEGVVKLRVKNNRNLKRPALPRIIEQLEAAG